MKGREISWRDHHYGRITGDELERFLGIFDSLWKDREELSSFSCEPAGWLDAQLKLAQVADWSALYDMSLLELVATLVMQVGISDEFLAAVKGGVGGLLEYVEDLSLEPSISNDDALPVVMAMIGNLEAISLYSRTINEMVQAAKEGSIEALCEALSVDAYLISRRFFISGMRLEQFVGRTDFTKAVMRTICGPHKRRHEYVRLRWAEYLLRDQGAFESCSREEIYTLLVDNLRLYDPHGERRDPKAALFAMFRKWQKQAGIQNPRFGFSGKRRS